MNALKKFLAKKSKTKVNKGDLGQESEWLEFSTMNLKGKRLLICDAMYVPAEDNGLETKLSPGHYLIQAKVMSYGGDCRVSRLRILPPDTEAKLGGVVGETGTDTALIAVCDLEVCAKASEALGEDKMEDICNDLLDKGDNCGVMVLDKKTEAVAPYVSSGFGDGAFKVFKLLNNRKTVGVEVEFIKAGTPYPFDLEAKLVTQVPVEKKPEGEMSVAEMFLEIFKDVGKQKTGDLEKDKALVQGKFDELKAKVENNLIEASKAFHQHIISLRRTAPPMCIKYVSTNDISWAEKPEAQKRIQFLRVSGFKLIGYFHTLEIKNHFLVVFARLLDGVVAEVSISQDDSISMCFSTEYQDGSDFTVVDKAATAGLTQAPWITKHFYPNLAPQDLFEVFLNERPTKPYIVQGETDVLRTFEEGFRRIQKWRAERGGWNSAEVKTQLGIGDEPESKERYESVQHAVTEKWMYSWLKIQHNLPIVLEDVMESLLIVHDFLSTDQLLSMWCYSTKDLGVREKMFTGLLPRSAFSKVNQERGNKLRLVIQKNTDIPADFYLPATMKPYFSA